MGRVHSTSYRRARDHYPDCAGIARLVVAADESEERARRAVVELGFEESSQRWRDVIEHPDVLEVAVVGSRDDAGLETVVAFAVPRQGRTIDAGAIEAHCRERMAAFKRPRRLVVVDGLPKTATGKVQRFALRARLEDERRG